MSARLIIALCCGVLTATAAPGRPVSEPYRGDLAIFEGAQREQNLQIDRVMDLLRIKAGSRVADIGAGSGWFSVRAARRVGAAGKVYAVEINPDYVAFIRARAEKEKLANIQTILGRPNDPLLPRNSIDAVMLLKTYHEIAEPRALLRHVHEALRKGGLVAIIDRNGKGDDHGLAAEVVKRELQQAGFAFVANYDFVKADGDDYFLLFRRSD